jgi:hypothetical protein
LTALNRNRERPFRCFMGRAPAVATGHSPHL